MKRNFLRILTTMTLALLISVPLSAQTIARATVPFDFTVGQTQLPAGTYEINPVAHASGIEIRNTNVGKSVLTVFRSEQRRDNDSRTKLVFNRYGDKYFLTQVSRGLEAGVMQLPTSKLEKEVRIASSTSQKVVVAAK